MRILVKFPTRSRPGKFLETLSKYQHTRETDDVHFLITIDADDPTMNNEQTIKSMTMWGNLSYEIIEPCGKIGAINHGVKGFMDTHPDYHIILLASDDMIPIYYGWDRRIMMEMNNHFPDTDGVLWFNDGFTFNHLNTLCILGRKYFNRFGYIYHPSYKALYCDNEFMDVAQSLGKQIYFPDCIIQHQHPIHNKGRGRDHLNFRDNQLMDTDRINYEHRKSNHFADPKPTVTVSPDTDVKQSKGNVQPVDGGTKPANRRGRPRKQSSDM